MDSGRNLREGERMAESFQTNMPLFQKYLPLSTYGGGLVVGLLLEAHDWMHLGRPGLAAVNVPQPGVRPGRADAEGQQGVGLCLGDARTPADGLGETFHRADDVVGGENGHRRVGRRRRQQLGGQGDGVGGVAAFGLADDVLRRQIRQGRPRPAAAYSALVTTRIFSSSNRPSSLSTAIFQQALAVQEGQQLLGPFEPAEGPEPLAGTAGQ